MDTTPKSTPAVKRPTSARGTTSGKPHPTRSARSRRRRQLTNDGWLPDQHGAWAMVTIPILIGIVVAHPAWIHIPLVIAWYSGYFSFFAASLYCKAPARRRAKFIRPTAVYGGISLVAALIVVALRWTILIWAIPFAPLVIIAVWEAWKKRPRSLASGLSTVVASALLIPVALFAAGRPIVPHMWAVTAVLGMYFCLSIPYVKTLIRNRGDHRWVIGSVVAHIIGVVITAALMPAHLVTIWAPLAMAICAVRAWWMPWKAEQRGTPWSPKIIGGIEPLWTILVVVGALIPA